MNPLSQGQPNPFQSRETRINFIRQRRQAGLACDEVVQRAVENKHQILQRKIREVAQILLQRQNSVEMTIESLKQMILAIDFLEAAQPQTQNILQMLQQFNALTTLLKERLEARKRELSQKSADKQELLAHQDALLETLYLLKASLKRPDPFHQFLMKNGENLSLYLSNQRE